MVTKCSLSLALLFLAVAGKGQRKMYSVGDTAFCGIIFFIQPDSSGFQKGLVVSLEDQSDKITWNGGSNIATNAVKDGLFDKSNADRIVARLGADSFYAAAVCARYSPAIANTFCDTGWYLPSKAELLLLYKTTAATKKIKFANAGYWTSLEFQGAGMRAKLQKKAWIVDFLNGKAFPVIKANKYRIRAIRAFTN